MRKALTLALTVALVTAFAMPLTLLAQNPVTAGTLAGRSVDAAGRGVGGQRVELVRGTQVLSVDTTNGLGEWSFRGVEPGDYIVRMNVRGRIAGVRVTVAAGQALAGTLIVVPTATVSLQLGTLANLITLFPTAAVATTAVASSATLDVETTALNPELLVAILERMPPAARQAFAEAVLDAIEGNRGGAFEQYKEQFEEIKEDPAAPIPTFPPPVAVSR